MTKNNNQPTGLSYVFFFLLFYLAAPPCLFSHYYFCNFRPLLESPCIEPTDDECAWTGGVNLRLTNTLGTEGRGWLRDWISNATNTGASTNNAEGQGSG